MPGSPGAMGTSAGNGGSLSSTTQYNGVAQHPEPFDLGLQDVPRFEDLWGGAREPHPWRHAGGDNVARLQGHTQGEFGDNPRNLEVEVLRIGILLGDPVDAAHDAPVVRIQLICGDDPRAEPTLPVQNLSLQVLSAVSPLQIAGGDVIQDGVSEDMAEGVPLWDVLAPRADDNGDFGFPVHLLRHGRVHGDGIVRSDNGGRRLGEEVRVGGKGLTAGVQPLHFRVVI